MQVIIERLEGESCEARQAAQQQADAREAALTAQYQKALHATQDSLHKQSERFVFFPSMRLLVCSC